MPDRDIDFLLIGGGIAAGNCARQLRRRGAEGSIMLVGREPDDALRPPPVVQGLPAGDREPRRHAHGDLDWYADNDIEALRRTSVTGPDLSSRSATLSDGQEIGFGQALLATGANVARLTVEGAQLDGIYYLRTFANTDAIRAEAAGKRVVLIGGSYTATEVAATLTALGSDCTMVFQEPLPLGRTFGEAGGRRQRVEHWDVALQQGQTVARNMLGQDLDHDVVPYFFFDIADWASVEVTDTLGDLSADFEQIGT